MSDLPKYSENTIIGTYLKRAIQNPDKVYIKSSYDSDGRMNEAIQSMTCSELESAIYSLAKSLIALDIESSDRVAVFGPNTPRWIIATFGIFAARSTFVPIYPSSKAEDVWWYLYDSSAKVVFVHSREHVDRVLEIRHRLESLEKIVVMDPDVKTDVKGVISFTDFINSGTTDKNSQDRVTKRIGEVSEEDVVAVFYTSGTTGRPKGVMLTNRNITSQLGVAREFNFSPDDIWFSHLPLCHGFGFTVDLLNCFYQGGTLYLVDSLEPSVIRKSLLECRPTVMISVPRMWEKLYLQIQSMVKQRPRIVQSLIGWAMKVGRESFLNKMNRRPIPVSLKIKTRLAGRIFKKMRKKGGLNRLRVSVTGGGPIHPDLLVFFGSIGINIYQGYGLTETSPVTHVCTPDANKIGCIGKPIPDTECRVDRGGELLIRGPQVMKGYWRNPDATAEVFTEDGFFRTGDIAEIDTEGYVRITDRIKEILITSGGKNIAPQPIQNAFDTDPYIEQIYIVGDGRKYLSAMVVPNFEMIKRVAKKQGVSFNNQKELVRNKAIYELLDRRIERVNASLSKYETIKRFAVLTEEFTEQDGELTPTMKFKRKVIEKKYKGVIEGLYPKEV